MSSDSSINSKNPWPDQDSSQNYALSGKIMLASIITLFLIVFFLVILHLYARWYLLRLHFRNRRNRRRNRIIFYVDNINYPLSSSSTAALDSTVLNSLPVFVYSESDVDMPECAVCLSEFELGETGRVLPKCKHCFHTGCIDMWFHSNSTCPLCRSPVEAVETQETSNKSPKRDDVGSSSDRTKRVDVRIEVPNRTELAAETESPSQGFRSPGGRLLSRIINMSRKSPGSGVGPSCVRGATELDIESAHE